ncbi:hypothetical protein SUGI_0298460 [Cryptomeria japonica]|nr:hypothetical protein SUGI_0298460 [Cryptomeria japonica]
MGIFVNIVKNPLKTNATSDDMAVINEKEIFLNFRLFALYFILVDSALFWHGHANSFFGLGVCLLSFLRADKQNREWNIKNGKRV